MGDGIKIGAIRRLRVYEESDFATDYIGPNGFEIQEATFRTDNYDAEQTIDAAYGMFDVAVTDVLRLAGGARVERTFQSVTVRNPPVTTLLPSLLSTALFPSSSTAKASRSSVSVSTTHVLTPSVIATYLPSALVDVICASPPVPAVGTGRVSSSLCSPVRRSRWTMADRCGSHAGPSAGPVLNAYAIPATGRRGSTNGPF